MRRGSLFNRDGCAGRAPADRAPASKMELLSEPPPFSRAPSEARPSPSEARPAPPEARPAPSEAGPAPKTWLFGVYEKDERRTTVTVSNCVATAFLGLRIPLDVVATECQGEFNPVSFAAAKLRLTNPGTTALVFGSGKIVCTGACSERCSYLALLKYVRLIRRCVPKVVLLDVKFQNIVSTASLGRCIDLDALHARIRAKTTVVRWNPQIFPGLRYQPQRAESSRCFVVVFATGKVVMTAARNRDEIGATWRQVWADVAACATNEPLTHTGLVKRKRLEELRFEEEEELEGALGSF